MEKRKSERVQFFQLTRDDEVMPVWVFQRASPDSILGLLLDISAEGAQILTDKSIQLPRDTYQLIVHAGEQPGDDFIALSVQRLWSEADGTLYSRHGFSLGSGEEAAASLDRLFTLHATGRKWLRCELKAV